MHMFMWATRSPSTLPAALKDALMEGDQAATKDSSTCGQDVCSGAARTNRRADASRRALLSISKYTYFYTERVVLGEAGSILRWPRLFG